MSGDAVLYDAILMLLMVALLGLGALWKVWQYRAATPLNFSRVFVRYGLPVLAVCCVAGLVCGGVHRYRTQGSVDESHRVDDYRLEISSERDPDYEECDGCVHDDVKMSVYRYGERIVEPFYIGYVTDPTGALAFSVRRLPNASLIIVTPTDRETEIVFAYDTANGQRYPCPVRATTNEEDWRKRQDEWQKSKAEWEARIQACPGHERYELRYLSGRR